MPLPPLLLRADAGGAQGSGHVMRLMALGEAWVDAGGACVLATAMLPEALAARVREGRGFIIEKIAAPAWSAADALALAGLAARLRAPAAVVDSYLYDPAYLETLAREGVGVAAIDDVGARERYPCALLINPNLHAEAALYGGRAEGAALLLGPRYVMLRREFAAHRASARPLAPHAQRLLVTFGGVDPQDLSTLALDALARQPELRVEFVIGAANPNAAALAARAAALPNVAAVRDVRDMAERMMAAEMILSAGGTTVWEAAALGAPMMLIAAAAEERLSAEHFARGGGCVFLGERGDLSAASLAAAIGAFADDLAARARSSVLGRELVDGFGAERVVEALTARFA